MKRSTDVQLSFFRALVAAMLVFGADASAQDYVVREIDPVLFVDLLDLPKDGQNGRRWVVLATSSPDGPSLNRNTLTWANVPNIDMVWIGTPGHGVDPSFQFVSFESEDDSVRNVFFSAGDGTGGFTDDYSPRLGIEHLFLENVNVDPGTVQLDFVGNSFTWKMSNARYSTADRTPLFKAGKPLEIRSVEGTSALAFWNGEIGSPTKLVVDSGTTLVFERVGNISLPENIPAQLFFSQEDANTADVNGGTLELAFSGVIFDTAPDATVAGGEVTGGFVVRNGGTLRLSGFDGSADFSRLLLRGGMLVDNGIVSLGERTTIELNTSGEDEKLVLNNATVNLEADAAFKADITTFGGTSTVTTEAPELGAGPVGFRSSITFQDSASVVNIRGGGDFFAEFLDLNGGTLNLEMDPNVGRLIATGLVVGPGQINVADDNILEIQDTLAMVGFGGTVDEISIENDGEIRVIAGGDMRGAGAITGNGSVVVESFGVLDARGIAGQGVMMIDQALSLELNSQLALAIDPSAAASSVLKVDNLLLDNPASNLAPTLIVALNNDIVLPVGQKFVLVDYASIGSGSTLDAQFRGLPDGGVFLLGANAYQIRYSDPDYGALNGGNDSVITLTVVESPYETWIGGYPGIPVDKRGPTDDADGDGCANIFEFAHKGDPTNPTDKGLMTSLIQDASAPAGDEFTLVVAMREGAVFSAGPDGVQTASVDGITCAVEGSLDLEVFPGSPVSHVGGPSTTAPPATALPDLTSTGWRYHTFKLDASEGLTSRGFMRTRVTLNALPAP